MSRLLLLWALLTPSLAHADVVSDAPCRSWEHWEGGHDGDCRFGPRCSATPGADDGAAVVPALVLAGALALRRARRRAH